MSPQLYINAPEGMPKFFLIADGENVETATRNASYQAFAILPRSYEGICRTWQVGDAGWLARPVVPGAVPVAPQGVALSGGWDLFHIAAAGMPAFKVIVPAGLDATALDFVTDLIGEDTDWLGYCQGPAPLALVDAHETA